jgi:quinol monooxygenase YgiN
LGEGEPKPRKHIDHRAAVLIEPSVTIDEQMTRCLQFLISAVALAAPGISLAAKQKGARAMYGLIAKITSTAGQRAELVAILGEGTRNMPGCVSYVISEDVNEENSVWVTEIWDSKASHDASLSLPSVKDVIAKAKPVIAGFTKIAETNPVAGATISTDGKR